MEHEPGLGGFGGAHHRVLKDARRLTSDVPENDVALANTARSYLAFWQADASILFRKEEEVLLPVLARHKEDLGEPVMRMLAQHASIRGLVMELGERLSGLRRDRRRYEAWGSSWRLTSAWKSEKCFRSSRELSPSTPSKR